MSQIGGSSQVLAKKKSEARKAPMTECQRMGHAWERDPRFKIPAEGSAVNVPHMCIRPGCSANPVDRIVSGVQLAEYRSRQREQDERPMSELMKGRAISSDPSSHV